MRKIIFVGSNPSIRSSSTVPFWHDTKSTKTINGWFGMLEELVGETDIHQIGDMLYFLNVYNNATPNNRPLKVSEIKQSLPRLKVDILNCGECKIIALGKTAQKALDMLGMEHYSMPHPSGLNRQLNDKNFVAEKINGLKDYLYSPFKSSLETN